MRELFDSQQPPAPKKTRAEYMKDIDSKYYGFLDDDDCRLVPLEIAAEERAVKIALAEYKEKKAKGKIEAEEEEEDIYACVPDMSVQDKIEEAMRAGKEQRFTTHVPIPSQKDIEEALLRRKKQELLAMYAIDDDDVEMKPETAKTEKKEKTEKAQAS